MSAVCLEEYLQKCPNVIKIKHTLLVQSPSQLSFLSLSLWLIALQPQYPPSLFSIYSDYFVLLCLRAFALVIIFVVSPLTFALHPVMANLGLGNPFLQSNQTLQIGPGPSITLSHVIHA
jgi:hypothetical protein